jgi:hypothetical protein
VAGEVDNNAVLDAVTVNRQAYASFGLLRPAGVDAEKLSEKAFASEDQTG